VARYLFVFLLLLLLIFAGNGNAQTPADEVTGIRNVTYLDKLLSVEFKGVPAGEALAEIGRLAGFEVVTDEILRNTPLTIRFESQPLEKGLTRIIRRLETRNYRYSFSDEGALETVVVMASSGPLPPQRENIPPTGTRVRTVKGTATDAQKVNVVRSRTGSTQEHRTSTKPGVTPGRNVVRRQSNTIDELHVPPTQGYLGRNWVTPRGIPANPEP